MNKYKHTQIGWVMIVVALAAMTAIVFSIHAHSSVTVGIDVAVFIGLMILFLFSTLTVIVDQEFVRFSFGVGLIKGKFAVKDIVSCRKIRTKWINGWGIHGRPGKGWLYNVSGFYAIELVMKNGMKYYIGTDDLPKLYEVVKNIVPATH